MIKTYEIHEFAALVPMASMAEQAALQEDIRANGLRETVVLWKGKIVDGRCRQLACIANGEKIRTRELDDELTENEVKTFVKSINTRRNLTMTQKVISACKTLIDPANASTSKELAMAWGIGKGILDNAKYIAKTRPDYIESLFNGEAVAITSSNGKETLSNKVSAVYASIKREEESIVEDTEHGWSPDSSINTQAGKDWFYQQSRNIESNNDTLLNYLLIELANYKFTTTN